MNEKYLFELAFSTRQENKSWNCLSWTTADLAQVGGWEKVVFPEGLSRQGSDMSSSLPSSSSSSSYSVQSGVNMGNSEYMCWWSVQLEVKWEVPSTHIHCTIWDNRRVSYGRWLSSSSSRKSQDGYFHQRVGLHRLTRDPPPEYWLINPTITYLVFKKNTSLYIIWI